MTGKWGTIEERFSRYVMPEPNSGCWLWTGHLDSSGYGVLRINPKSLDKAHRVSFRLSVGDIPDGFEVCHRCDVRWCVNPEHLFLGTHAENMADMARKGRSPRTPPVFGQGHKLAKLSDGAAREIYQQRHSGISGRALAKAYGVSSSLIYLIWQRRAWRRATVATPILPSPILSQQEKAA